jgi:transposase
VGGLRLSGKRTRPQAQILFDRFHIVKHLNDAVEEVRRSEMRRQSQKEKVPFKRSRWLLLKNPWNLSDDQKERLSTLVQWNMPIVRASYLKEAFNCSGFTCSPSGPSDHLEKWMRSAHALPVGALQEIRTHTRSFGLRTAENFIAAIYHCCARLPLPVER